MWYGPQRQQDPGQNWAWGFWSRAGRIRAGWRGTPLYPSEAQEAKAKARVAGAAGLSRLSSVEGGVRRLGLRVTFCNEAAYGVSLAFASSNFKHRFRLYAQRGLAFRNDGAPAPVCPRIKLAPRAGKARIVRIHLNAAARLHSLPLRRACIRCRRQSARPPERAPPP